MKELHIVNFFIQLWFLNLFGCLSYGTIDFIGFTTFKGFCDISYVYVQHSKNGIIYSIFYFFLSKLKVSENQKKNCLQTFLQTTDFFVSS